MFSALDKKAVDSKNNYSTGLLKYLHEIIPARKTGNKSENKTILQAINFIHKQENAEVKK